MLIVAYYVLKREYDTDGNWISQTYLEDKLNPFTVRSEYASIRRKYNSIGKIESEMYFDTDGLPAMDTYRKYGYHKEYDADKHVAAVICLDSDRNTMTIRTTMPLSRRLVMPTANSAQKTYMIRITPQRTPKTVNSASFI